MAEKKFFVDINLQGNKLVNPVVGSNSSMTAEGSFQYNAGRLEYYNGSTVQEVANLNDIAAVTGGLILQGGYDADTNTPDIADGSALKGYFWVVTVAGLFLGESVQVGDSIIAKIDEAGATLSDWLILQGNVVIATDSVDGISRLATQTEANDGTEGGAVVITPATLQGKIDAQITPEINSKVSKSGDTMSGNLNMGGNHITNVSQLSNVEYISGGAFGIEFGNEILSSGGINAQNNPVVNVPAPTNGGDATNKTYVDDQDALKVSKSGDTMSGSLDMGGNDLNNVQYVNATGVATDQLISTTTPNIALGSNLDADNAQTIINLPAPTNGGDAANKTYVDDNTSNKLPLAGGTMTGNIDMGGSDVTNVSTLKTAILTNNDDPENPYIIINKDLNFHGVTKAIGLPTPTNGGDAANKDYVDNAASTAESNANNYTDTAVDALSFGVTIATGDWTFTGSQYTFAINHNLNSSFLTYSVLDMSSGVYVEASIERATDNISEIAINNLPNGDFKVSVVKAGGNL